MTIRHCFNLSVMVFIIMIGHFVCPTEATASYEFHFRLSTLLDESTLKPLEVQPPLNQRITVLKKRLISQQVPRQRNIELSSQHLVVIGLDEHGREIARVVVVDPRLIRSEIFNSSGEIISNKLIYRENVEFSLVFTDDSRLYELKFYHPHWTGTNFVLEPIGKANLNDNKP